MIHYSEVALKGNNRPEFVRALRRNTSRALRDLGGEVISADGRFVATCNAPGTEVVSRLSKVFGLAWFAPTLVAERDYDDIAVKVLECAKSGRGTTFKVQARRSDKEFPLSSHELAVRLGSEVAEATGMKVQLSEPDLTIHVDVTRRSVYVYGEKLRGPGGLPVGTSGRVVHLFSGGIDSPAAAWLLMKRGCNPVYLHFYLAPTPQSAIESKISRLVHTLSVYSGGRSTLVLVPFDQYQLATSGVPPDLEPSLFRRFMRMTAEALAPGFRASAISTGDSLAQAASQTLWNLAAFDQGSTLPVLRPLLSYDKEEVVGLAKGIGTYELSLEAYKDCCAIITRHPKTRVKPEVLSRWAEELSFNRLIAESLARATLVVLGSEGEPKVAPLSTSIPRAAPGL